jgi:hypothetical protein
MSARALVVLTLSVGGSANNSRSDAGYHAYLEGKGKKEKVVPVLN